MLSSMEACRAESELKIRVVERKIRLDPTVGRSFLVPTRVGEN